MQICPSAGDSGGSRKQDAAFDAIAIPEKDQAGSEAWGPVWALCKTRCDKRAVFGILIGTATDN
jgi:hypothetical protein